MSVQDHRATSPVSVRCAVLTVSDTRGRENDASGGAIVSLLERDGHMVVAREWVKDEPAAVSATVRQWVIARDARVIITTGGTGITSRDRTYEAVTSLFDARIDGFGELFRSLSYPEIGAAAMLTRASAGIIDGRAVFLLPGSEHAVRLGMEKLILPELGHLVRELSR